jgi:monothiol glutaredoxin
MNADIQKKIAEDVKKHKIIMYVKGNKEMPMCGFSKRVMDIFLDLGADFETRDVLADPEIREGVKAFTQWPTIPQIFINGEFIGGCDIVTDLYVSGELKKMVESTK